MREFIDSINRAAEALFSGLLVFVELATIWVRKISARIWHYLTLLSELVGEFSVALGKLAAFYIPTGASLLVFVFVHHHFAWIVVSIFWAVLITSIGFAFRRPDSEPVATVNEPYSRNVYRVIGAPILLLTPLVLIFLTSTIASTLKKTYATKLTLEKSATADAELERQLAAYDNLRHLELHYAETTDDGFAPIARFKQLEVLRLHSAQDFYGWGLNEIGTLPSLKQFTLDFAIKFDDGGIESIRDWTELEILELSDTQITDVGVARLGGLEKLRTLRLSRTRVTDEGVASLRNLADLEILDLEETQITNTALTTLGRLTNLNTLRLSKNAITDKGLTSLRPLTKLEHLQIDGTDVTVAGLEQLRELPNLTYVWVNQERISETDAAAFEESFGDREFYVHR